MTDNELHDIIHGDTAAKALADAGNDEGAARRAAEIARVPAPALATERTVFAAFANPADGEAVLTALEAAAAGNGATARVVKRALRWLQPGEGGLDVGNASVRAMIDQLAAGGVLTPTQAATLKGLGERPATVSASDVSRAWARYRPDGRIV